MMHFHMTLSCFHLRANFICCFRFEFIDALLCTCRGLRYARFLARFYKYICMIFYPRSSVCCSEFDILLGRILFQISFFIAYCQSLKVDLLSETKIKFMHL